MSDVREIKLNMRYPESRQEDITDAFTRGYTGAIEIGNKAIKKLEAENAKLRELARGLQYCANEAYGMCARVPVGGSRPFTCCPLYDFDAKVYGCEKLRLELGIGIEQ